MQRRRATLIKVAGLTWIAVILVANIEAQSAFEIGLWLPTVALPIGAALLARHRPFWVMACFWLAGSAACLVLPTPDNRYSFTFVMISVLETTVGYLLVTRWAGVDGLRRELRQIFGFLAAAGATSVVSYGCAWLVFLHLDYATPWHSAVPIALSRFLTMLIVLPFFIPGPRSAPSPRWEFWLQTGCAVVLSASLFLVHGVPYQALLILPLMTWLALRASYVRMALVCSIFSAAAMVATMGAYGAGKELRDVHTISTSSQLFWLQMLILGSLLVGIPLSFTVSRLRDTSTEAGQERRRMQRLVQAATGAAIVIVAPDGEVTRFGRGGENLLGYSADEVTQGTAVLLARVSADSETIPLIPLLISRARSQDGEVVECELEVRQRDGVYRPMTARMSTVLSADGAVQDYLLALEEPAGAEVLERLLREERAASAKLVALDHAQTEFVATVSHELRSPLTSIIGYTELLHDIGEQERNALEQQMIDAIDRGGRRLLKLVDDLIAVAQASENPWSGMPEELGLVEVVEVAVADCANLLFAGDHELLRDYGAPDTRVRGDGDQLARMVTNLLTNAVRFSQSGEPIRIRTDASAGTALVEVVDSGPGIPEAESGQIFERFFRGRYAHKWQIPGVGLGLFVAREIARAHGGDLAVTSRLGSGSTFTATLPAVSESEIQGEDQRANQSGIQRDDQGPTESDTEQGDRAGV